MFENLFNPEKFSALVTEYTPKAIGAILVLFIGFWLAGLVTRQAKKAMSKSAMDVTIIPFLASLVNVGLKVLVLLSAARMFGIETTSFVAVFGALAFAIGLALQGSLGHFASGVLILTFRPYKVGDLVEIAGKTGTVKEIQIFNTVLATADNRRHIIPNGVVTSGVITNVTGQEEMRIFATFGIGYGDDIDKAKRILREVAEANPHVLTEKGIDIWVANLGDSSVDLSVRPWTKSENYWSVIFYLNEEVKKAFDREGISIPFPQRDVHLIKEE